MIEKLELLKGTKEELEEYFYKEIGIKPKGHNDFYTNLAKGCAVYTELSDTNTVKKQIEEIEGYQKSIGMIAYLKAIMTDEIPESNRIDNISPTVQLTIETKFVYVINKEIREKIKKELYK